VDLKGKTHRAWSIEHREKISGPTLLPSLYKREEFPLFGKEGAGEISE